MKPTLLIPALTVGCLCACAAPEEEPAPLEVVREAEETPGVDPEVLEAAIARIEEDTDTRMGLSLYDGHEHHSFGSVASLPAWSTVKIPIAFAAMAHCEYDEDYIEELITLSIEISDNDATNELWACLNAAGGAEELVREEIGSRVEVAWGRTAWPFASQAEYAYKLSQRDDLVTNPIINHMQRIDEEQSWGLGALGMPFKGGWGDIDEDGSWQSRQMAFGQINGVTYGIAAGALSEAGSFEATTQALDELAAVLAGL